MDEQPPPDLPASIRAAWGRGDRPTRGPKPGLSLERIVDAGAIPLAVTNTSELCMWIESENRVYGRTRNAYDEDRIAGGDAR